MEHAMMQQVAAMDIQSVLPWACGAVWLSLAFFLLELILFFVYLRQERPVQSSSCELCEQRCVSARAYLLPDDSDHKRGGFICAHLCKDCAEPSMVPIVLVCQGCASQQGVQLCGQWHNAKAFCASCKVKNDCNCK